MVGKKPSAGSSRKLGREDLAAVLDRLPVGVFVLDATGQAVFASTMAQQVLGRGVAADTTAHMLAETYDAHVAGSDELYPTERMPVVRALTGETSRVDDMEIRRPERTVPMRVWGAPIFDGEGRVAYAVAAFEDVSEVRQAEGARREADERFRVAFDHAPIGMALVALDGHFAQANRAMCTLTGYSGPELLGMTFQEVTHADDVDADSEFLGRLLAGELSSYQMEKRYVRPSGDVRWALLSRSLVRTSTGKPLHFVTQAEDITERRQAQEELAHQAFHDPLTGLANRALLLDRLQHGLDRIGRHDATLAVFYLDLDNLKVINDTLGHQGGDEALVGVARALRSSARAEDTVARVGGDEFVVVIENLDEAAVAMVLQRMEHALAQVVVGTSRMSVDASIGIARASASENTADGLLRQADAAMYAVKLSRRATVNDS